MSARCIISLYPKSAFTHRVSFIFDGVIRSRSRPGPWFAREKYEEIDLYFNCTPHTEHLLGMQGGRPLARYMCDSDCWSIFYNESGDVVSLVYEFKP